ncbi:mob1/phocein family protein [Hirsutella rhossiliensis]|uniref:Mob1/phocein family domain-containing protein n=1 Tax=Hirsutella rhossiliensis TaxID=111463 RepID=A0A9P8SMS6_9HYPO|nr:mob1/phocein family domain-containing protein [Hirsutella rhossiliensis]KAH0968913.1 mob1/phocein family domain-containing protein [Hirsutella rhossiliensis]
MAQSQDLSRTLPLWLDPSHAKHIVRGNLTTLSARPKTVEPGEWVAHQGNVYTIGSMIYYNMYHHLTVSSFLVVEHYQLLWSFVRLVHDKEGQEHRGASICKPATCPKMSAGQNHSYTWLDEEQKPVELPAHECITHLQRWISAKINNIAIFPTDPSGTSSAFDPSLEMLERHELEPMQDLINLWVADGTFPAESKAYVYGDLERGQFLLRLGAGR